MKKVCVFCGKPPNKKNKEHIIPKWLMKLTNTENKNMSVGSNWKTGKELIFNFSAFTFPSCTKCNTDFGEIEALIKPTIIKILNDEYVDEIEINRLLDWFDKVRVSLWLAIQYLNKDTFNLEPKYYINNRIGIKDRMLAITNCYDNEKNIKWTGVNTLCFIMNPTCFTLKINNVLFVNCSSDFIVSKQLGFPFPKYIRQNPNSHLTDFKLKEGLKRKQTILFKKQPYNPSVIISQPIFGISKELQKEYYNNEYVKNNSKNYKDGIGYVFITENNETYVLNEEDDITFIASKPNIKKKYKFNKPTLEFQLEILQYFEYNLDLLPDNLKEQHKKALSEIISYSKEQIKQFDY